MSRKSSLKTFLIAALGAVALLALPAVASAKDRNRDRIPDRWEKRHHLSLQVKQSGRDQDRDQLRNRAEFLAGDDPRDSDSDDDGVTDGEEKAGAIQSFDPETGRLTIALFGGDIVSGLVTDETEIKCPDRDEATASHEDEDEVGDDHGELDEPGDDESDDHGDDGSDDADEDHSGPGSPSSGPGEHGDDDGECDRDRACTTADLTEGATVEEAELKLENGMAVFEEVELAD